MSTDDLLKWLQRMAREYETGRPWSHGDFQVAARAATTIAELERERDEARAERDEALRIADDLERTHPDPYDSAYQLRRIRSGQWWENQQ